MYHPYSRDDPHLPSKNDPLGVCKLKVLKLYLIIGRSWFAYYFGGLPYTTGITGKISSKWGGKTNGTREGKDN